MENPVPNTKPKIVLIHGFPDFHLPSFVSLLTVECYVRAAGFEDIDRWEWPKRVRWIGLRLLESGEFLSSMDAFLSRQVESSITDQVMEQGWIAICHSAGGTALLSWLKNHRGEERNLRAVILIASPHTWPTTVTVTSILGGEPLSVAVIEDSINHPIEFSSSDVYVVLTDGDKTIGPTFVRFPDYSPPIMQLILPDAGHNGICSHDECLHSILEFLRRYA